MIDIVNNPQTFPELNLHHLQGYANRWATGKPCEGLPLSSIILYRYRSIVQMYLRKTVPTKFVVVFEFHNTDIYTDSVFSEASPHRFESTEEFIKHIHNEANDSAEVKRYREFVRHTQYFQSGKKTYNAFFDSSFSTTIYRIAPNPEAYKQEWRLFPKPPADEMLEGACINEPHWVLWSATDLISDQTLSAEIAFCDDGFVPDKPNVKKAQSNEWQTETAKWAIKNGFIAATDLVCILAADETYIEILPEMWRDFQMDLKGDECPDPSTYNSRIDIWAALLRRWTHNEILGVDRNNQIRCGVRGTIRQDRLLEHEARERRDEDGEISTDVRIRLDNLERHLSELVESPLPGLLFPKETETAPKPTGGNTTDHDGDVIERQPSSSPKQWPNIVSPVHTGADIGWQDVTITFMGDEEFLVQYGTEHTERRFNRAGFENRKNGKPINSWIIFRESANKGGLPFKSVNRKVVEKTAQTLNRKLSELFPNLPRKPIQLNIDRDGYHFAFQIAVSEYT